MRLAQVGLYALKRIVFTIPLLLAVIVVNFTLIQLAPGDPALVLVGDYPAPPGYVESVRHEFGLDQPLPVQILRYIEQVLHGNLGFSFANRLPVLDLVLDRLGATLELTLSALLFATICGVLLGIVAARRRGKPVDSGVQALSLAGYSVPEFWLGQILIIVFAVWLEWLPSQGSGSLRSTATGFDALLESGSYLLLPALALSVRYLALISRMMRASLLEVLNADYILAARSRGVSDRRVLYTHALRNAAAPVVTVIGYNLGFILAGSALTETVFGWPGIGRLLFDSIGLRDYPVMLGILLMISVTVVLSNLLTDIAYRLIDPRMSMA